MKLILCSIDPRLDDAWRKTCDGLDFVSFHAGSILEAGADAVVSPANSFGFMDGGLDALYLDYFPGDIQMRVRRQIFDHHAGELLVGTADIVETGHDAIPFLIAAPTMRVPMVLTDSVNAYLAARAVFLLVRDGVFRSGPHTGKPVSEHVGAVAMPGLGTGVGRIAPDTCARQVRTAIDEILLGGYRMPQSWAEASERHQLLYTDRPVRLQY
ncbi:MAG TPA: macro domain-containing protein [Hyphomicrobiaceae bacterium]|jgi:O-acetyl-ADP-ribose deacetylase (regulator of RNase III)|nr:macro domain-containing protein [Hyphomicrobiaceae bacterium]